MRSRLDGTHCRVLPRVSEIDTNVRHPKNKNAPAVRFSLPLMGPDVRAHPDTWKTVFFRHKREQLSKGRGTHEGTRAGG
jgi:hypothetical protein